MKLLLNNSGLFLDKRGEGIPIMQNLVESENQEVLETIFLHLKQLCPLPSSKVQIMISDLARSFQNAWKAVFGQSTQHVSCSWHFEKAMDINIKPSALLSRIKKLRTITDKKEFELQFSKLVDD